MSRSQPDDIITTVSSHTVAQTVDRLIELIRQKNMKLFAIVDHSGGAREVGLAMPDTKLIVFGAPRSGTPVMQAVPLAALDLPLRVLVQADNEGVCHVSYFSTAVLVDRYGLTEELVAPLDGVRALVAAAGGGG